MKKGIFKTFILLFLLVATQTFIYSATDSNSRDKGSAKEEQVLQKAKKILIVYYSHSGSTKEIATQIQKTVGGDLFEIQTIESYPAEYNALTKQAKDEINRGYKPALKNRDGNTKAYDIIFIGSPVWWGTIAPSVTTFLSENDLSGKIVIPFSTHLGSGLANCAKDTAKLCPKSTVLDGKAFSGNSVKTSQNEVTKWLDGIKALK